MEVAVLLDRGEFAGVFSTPEAAMKYYKNYLTSRSIHVEVVWNQSGGDFFVDKECKLGTVQIHVTTVRN